MADLSNEDKLGIISSHQRNVEYNQYNIQMSMLEEKAKAAPDQTIIDNLQAQLNDCAAQISVLEAQAAALTPAAPTN